MSYTTIIAVYPNEKIEYLTELKNGWGSAPVIWNAMTERYLTGRNWMGCGQELWDLWKRKDIPLHHRAVHVMTFDRIYIAKKDYKRAAADIRAFLADFPQNENAANHWPWIANFLDSEPEYPAIGFWHTSVSSNPFDGPWNEEKEANDPPDWSDVYDLYIELARCDEDTVKATA